jgi:hypothetical protein
MMIRVVVLLKFDGSEAISSQRGRLRKFLDEVRKIVRFLRNLSKSIYRSKRLHTKSDVLGDRIVFIDLDLDSTLGGKLRDNHRIYYFAEYIRICLAS